jgi:E3 ubiquitin-protein transferase RMND5
MEALQNEHEKLWKSSKASKTIDQTQEIIDLLQRARDAIAADSTSTQISLTKLQNPVKTAFDGMNTSLREIYGGQNKYARALDKLFKDKTLLSDEIDALSSHSTLINRAIYLHLLREGLFDVANTLHNEAEEMLKQRQDIAASMGVNVELDHPLGLDKLFPEDIERQFSSMYNILSELKERNLQPAIEWARQHSEALEVRGSNLEFELCRLQYVNLFLAGTTNENFALSGQMRAVEYAQNELQSFRGRYLYEIQQLLGAMAFCSNLEDSPYCSRFNNTTVWDEVGTSFTREFCSLLELSADSPLYIATTAGAIALPTLVKLQNIKKEKRTEWTTENELPVEILLPPSYQFHSIFVCPVSKEQTTDQNPPMMIPCGHVLAQESLQTLSKGIRFKCPYCPRESHPKDAKRVYL